jgi:CheY-like chemotaxis protein
MLEGVRILLVDDNADSRELGTMALSHLGATVVTASNAREGLAMLAAEPPDVLLCDIVMPDGDGLWLIQEVRADSRFATVPAIALTAMARDVDRDAALQAGYDAHIAKPAPPGAVPKAIARVLGR